MEVRPSSMIGPNVAMWLHVQATYCGYMSICMTVLLLSHYLEFSFLYALMFWAIFDVHALVIIAMQYRRYKSEVKLQGLFEKSHDYICTLLFKLLLLLRLGDVELDLFAIGSLLYLPLLLCCFVRSSTQDLQYCNVFAISAMSRTFRAVVFTLVAIKEEINSEWPWELVLFPIVLVGMLIVILLTFGVFIVIQQIRDYRLGTTPRHTLLTVLWYQFTGSAYAISLIVWYHGTKSYISGTGYSPIAFVAIASMHIGLAIYIILSRKDIQ